MIENWMQDLVSQFHRIAGHPRPTRMMMPSDKDAQRQLNMILEEATELSNALGYRVKQYDHALPPFVVPQSKRPNVAPEKVVKELCDLLYVTLSLAVTMGVPLSRFFTEVHASNMTKIGGEKRADGKLLKPVGYKEPDIKTLLEELLNGRS